MKKKDVPNHAFRAVKYSHVENIANNNQTN